MCLEGWPAVEAEYHNPNPPNTPNTRRYRGISYTTPINAAKEAVPIIDLADLLAGPGGLRKVGKEWAGRCPLPDHEDRSPSFTANPEKNVWFCHGCLRGGDVVELYRLYHGYDQREAHTAAAMLLLEFGHTPPERPPAWIRKNERQRRTRELIEDARLESLTRRLWKYVFAPIVETIEDEEERQEIARKLLPKVQASAKYLLADKERVNR
jgi:DNA primase